MSEVYEIADRYVLAYAALDPIEATDAGIAGHEHELTDFSPDAGDARAPARPRHPRRARAGAADDRP